jgi:hypothetical protein
MVKLFTYFKNEITISDLLTVLVIVLMVLYLGAYVIYILI